MATAGSFTIVASVAETLDAPENRFGTITDYLNLNYRWVDGTGVGQNDLVWSDRFTIAGGDTAIIDLAPLALDLGGGAGSIAQTDTFGNAITFVEVTAICISNRETVAGSRTVSFGPGAGNPFLWLFLNASDLISIVPAGGYTQWSDQAQTVGAGASDTLRFINTDGANAVSLDLILVGRTA
jgi:hypothetical protein